MTSLSSLKNKIAVVGVGNTAYGSFPETSDYGLAAKAFKAALADCGLERDQIDGLLVCRIPYYARMGEILGLDPALDDPDAAARPHVRHGDRRGDARTGNRRRGLCRAALRQQRTVAPHQLWRRRGGGTSGIPGGSRLRARRTR
ncbi:MAG: hypothetical protein WDN44_05895 [Sphingomonas sp.]